MLNEEELKRETGTEVEDSTADYLEAIKSLKQNTVDRSKYDALKAENKKLIDAVVNGQELDISKTSAKEETIEELREKVFRNPDQTNLEYWTNVLKLRDRVLEENGEDIFVASSSQYSPNLNDYADAQGVAQAFQEMVDIANGDPQVFLNEYQRRVKEDKLPNRRK